MLLSCVVTCLCGAEYLERNNQRIPPELVTHPAANQKPAASASGSGSGSGSSSAAAAGAVVKQEGTKSAMDI